ncbi:hypothetical protein BDZ97DRAFT_1849186, partial [Flammula alnicola]
GADRRDNYKMMDRYPVTFARMTRRRLRASMNSFHVSVGIWKYIFVALVVLHFNCYHSATTS